MTRDPRYDVLFEPVRIGPVTARNRFYQVPHCNGMGRTHPTAMAVMRGIKAEGGWAVVCTEQCDIHPTSETTREIRLWDDRDIPSLARMTEQVHEHGGLAGIELTHMGYHAYNVTSREVPMAPSATPAYGILPQQAREMDISDIADYRRWHRAAARRSKEAGFDIIVVYAGHDLSLLMHFLSPRTNRRTDEYGGSVENRARLLREVIEDTKQEVGDSCGVAVRVAVDELLGEAGITSDREGRAVLDLLGELPDLWDINVSEWHNDSQTSRFSEEGFQEAYISFAKQHTSKPVVGVGRYTSPDHMVSLINKGVFDMIGAARPSIADPFLPKKIEEGRLDDIRECIGCNICVASDMHSAPIRCTQNPTMGEEWRRDWHPERITPKDTDDRVLVVGAGPAGLEAAMSLGRRGYDVMLAEAGTELGGRVARECRLPGLSAWGRVRDYRTGQLNKLANVGIYLDSAMTAESVLETGCSLVAVAGGATWRRDGTGRSHVIPIPGLDDGNVFTPDDVMGDAPITGPVVVFDDDHYYMGGVTAEKLRSQGLQVTLVTPMAEASAWTVYTLELDRIQKRLLEAGVEILGSHTLSGIGGNEVETACVHTGRIRRLACASVVLVTGRDPDDMLFDTLTGDPDALVAAGIRRLTRIGDALAPGTIAAAIWSGHRFARELGERLPDGPTYRYELPALAEPI
ncbi:MAG: NAD(P)-binding protein [Alphaproteobacteria bacterium]|jgi:dimethylamine/trimethylamine dehydrogenase|nr:NAD(P)-binding protein [Alphaproteobacteria bacterium]MDP6815635.1 NAD(P)-binding protein [Alphaproteobacteria bacterium]